MVTFWCCVALYDACISFFESYKINIFHEKLSKVISKHNPSFRKLDSKRKEDVKETQLSFEQSHCREVQGGWWKQHCKRQQRREKCDIPIWRRLTVAYGDISTMTSQWLLFFSTQTLWAGLALQNVQAYPCEGAGLTCVQTHWPLAPHHQTLAWPD